MREATESHQRLDCSDFISKALEKHKKKAKFIECIENGALDDLKEIEIILNEDESRSQTNNIHQLTLFFNRYILDQNDPDNIINQHNFHGETPLCIACRNGSFSVRNFPFLNSFIYLRS